MQLTTANFEPWTRVMKWIIANSLGHIPKDGPEANHHNFDPSFVHPKV